MQSISPIRQEVTIPPAARHHTERACFAIIWVKGANEQTIASIVQDSTEIDGVNSAKITRVKPCILLADYNPDVTNARKILELIQRPGVQSRIVGC